MMKATLTPLTIFDDDVANADDGRDSDANERNVAMTTKTTTASRRRQLATARSMVRLRTRAFPPLPVKAGAVRPFLVNWPHKRSEMSREREEEEQGGGGGG